MKREELKAYFGKVMVLVDNGIISQVKGSWMNMVLICPNNDEELENVKQQINEYSRGM